MASALSTVTSRSGDINRNSGLNTGEWSCTACTLKNSDDKLRCAACGSYRVSSGLEGNDKRNNNNNSVTRATSDTRKTPSVSSTHSTGPRVLRNLSGVNINRFWSCEQCTLLNPPNFGVCSACAWIKPITRPNSNISHSSSASSLSISQRERVIRRQSNDPRAPLKPGVQETFDEIAATCSALGEPFVDDSFPPGPKSVFINAIGPSSGKTVDSHTKFRGPDLWLRPKDIRCSEEERSLRWTIMKDASPSDIVQGQLGDCWVMGSLAVLAERKELLENIIQTKEVNPFGVYIIRLNHYGRWKDVIVDDLLPCDKHGRLIFARGKRKQLWVPLIEKAMAKLNGSYEALSGGSTSESLTALTGFPCSTIYLNESSSAEEQDLTWATLVSSASASFLLGAGSHSRDPVKMVENEKMGLQSRHAYSILEVNDDWGPRLIKLRNPWGKESWKGNWSSSSPSWTPAMKEAFRPKSCDRGVFWMSFEDFLKHFDVVYICRIRQNWEYNSFHGIILPYADDNNHPCYRLVVEKPTEIDVTLYQCSWSRLKEPQSCAPDIALIVLQISNANDAVKDWKLINYSNRVRERDVNINTMLDPGKYALIPVSFAHWTDNDNEDTFPEYQIMIHSSKPIKCNRISPSGFLLAETIIKVAIDSGQKQKLHKNHVFLYHHSNIQKFGRGSVFVVENNYSNRWALVEINFQESFNVSLTRGERTRDCIPPKSRQVINVLTSCDSRDSYRIGTNVRTIVGAKHESPVVGTFGFSIPSSEYHVPPLNPRNNGLHCPRPFEEVHVMNR